MSELGGVLAVGPFPGEEDGLQKEIKLIKAGGNAARLAGRVPGLVVSLGKIAVQKALEDFSMTGFIIAHFVDRVMDGVEVPLLGHDRQVLFPYAAIITFFKFHLC
jgi:hypothetical protein